MDVQAPSGHASGAGSAPPSATVSQRLRDTALNRAQPVMGQAEAGPHLLPDTAFPLEQMFDEEPRIRRRPNSGGPAATAGNDGWQELTAFRRIAEDIRGHGEAEASASEKALRSLGCDYELIDALIGRQQMSLRAQRALAAGMKPSQAQRAHAFALCVFDVNRWAADRELLGAGEEGEIMPAAAAERSSAALAGLVKGAKRLTAFDGLKPTIDLWARLRLDPRGGDWNVMWFTLVSHTGLFETNARRVLHAFAEAMAVTAPAPLASAASSADADFAQRMRSCLLRQWLAGPGEQERKMLDGLSCDDNEIFHRKLTQQFALLCRHYGQPLPPMVELILVDDPD